VLDPAGEATRAAAARLGVEGVKRLRIGKAGDIVDHVDAEIEHRTHHLRFPGIDRQRPAAIGQGPDNRNQPTQFEISRHDRRARTGRFGAKINQIDPVVDHRHRMLDRRPGVWPATTIRKRIRGEIEHPHDQGALERQLKAPAA
jgi:hypothetical protein